MLLDKISKRIKKELLRPIETASIVNLVDNIILFGYYARASDIHIQPKEDSIVIRYRIDGIANNIFEVPKNFHEELISRIKILAGLRSDEHFSAQDGRFRFYLENEENYFDVRVSIMPTYYGENAVLRLLVSSVGRFKLEDLGFSERDLEEVKMAISKPYGMILSTGPTGSGKTTLLYTILNILNTEKVHIITIEDPIEYAIGGLTQIQVNPQTNLTFGKGLKAILRQDPNIIMVGEIRDQETAEIAVNASLTGHLLLSTLHTNDAPSAIIRLIELGVEPYLIASTVNIIIGQRLVRKICNFCKKEKKLKENEINSLKEVLPERTASKLNYNLTVYYGEGCKNCNNSGYLGRTGIYEVLSLNEEIKDLILKRAGSYILKESAMRNGMTTMLEDGILKVVAGITTIEEILRVIHE
jgi:type II secretory ATPase GspE/PulE/Tfp pilus assembly ATPase PilB-like protein